MNTGKLAIGAALTLAVVVASSSTTVLAMSALPRHSVGTQQLKTSAVTTKKIHKHAVTGSRVKPNTFVGSPQMAFGKGFATSVPAKTVLKLPRLHVTVTTDGTASTDPNVVVHVPKQKSYVWIFQTDGANTYSAKGGAVTVDAPSPGNTLSLSVSRFDNRQEFYLHCAFDSTGFSTSRPLSCWAVSN